MFKSPEPNRFSQAIVFPPATPSRVLRYATHPCGTASPPLTGPRPPGKCSAYEALWPKSVRPSFSKAQPLILQFIGGPPTCRMV